MTNGVRDRLYDLLERLDRELDRDDEEKIHELHRDALEFRPVDRLPVVVACSEEHPEDMQPYAYSEAVEDPEKMLFNELVSAFGTSILRRGEIGDDLPATVRANFGTIMVASCFGARLDWVDDNPPWVHHFETRDDLVRSIEKGADLNSTSVERAIEFMEFYHHTLADFPELREIVKIVIPDLQGPLDNAAMLRGSDIFIEMATDADFVSSLLSQMAQTQLELWRRFFRLAANEDEGYVHQHGVLGKGNILIRNDSSIMISSEMYEDLVRPRDVTVLDGVGGGGIHSCGDINHLFPVYAQSDFAASIDYGQSWMNDLDAQYDSAASQGVALLRVRAERDELVDATILDRFPTGVSLIYESESVDEARETLSRYRDAAEARSV